MAKVLVLFFSLFSFFAYGVYVSMSTSNMPTTYTAASAGSKLGLCSKGNLFSIYNGTGSVVAWAKGIGADNRVPTSDLDEIPANTGVDRDGYVDWDGTKSVYVRSLSGSAITSGYIIYSCGRK